MKLRLTVRRLMVAVAIVGLGMGTVVVLWRRHERFRQIASHHHEVSLPYIVYGGFLFPTAKIAWHIEMEEKYVFAARRPWLPVAPDPPEPR